MSIIHPGFESIYVFFKDKIIKNVYYPSPLRINLCFFQIPLLRSYVFLSVSASESRHIKMKSSRHIDDSISEPSSEI